MIITLVILALSAIFFMAGKIRSDLIALCSLILLVLFGILTPAEALSGFSNSVVIMMVGLFVVGGAIFQTGLAKMVSGKIMQAAGKNQLRLFLLVMLVTSFVGAFVSNTGTVALMLPIVVSLAKGVDMIAFASGLMPLAFASSMEACLPSSVHPQPCNTGDAGKCRYGGIVVLLIHAGGYSLYCSGNLGTDTDVEVVSFG